MLSHCVNKSLLHNSEDRQQYEEIQKHFHWSDAVTDVKLGTWMSMHNSDRFPTVQEMELYEKAIKTDKTRQKSTTSTAKTEEEFIKEKALADGTFMKAPNGKPTNLTERQWLQVRTKAFKEWFGDWKNDPANASKVVDENGEPLVVYRIDVSDFTVFDRKHLEDTRPGFFGSGFYFSNDLESVRRAYSEPGRNARAFFLNIKDYDLHHYDESELYGEMPKDRIITFEHAGDDFYKEYIVKNPNQIKSATDNKGEFSNENDDIYQDKIINTNQAFENYISRLINYPKTFKGYRNPNKRHQLTKKIIQSQNNVGVIKESIAELLTDLLGFTVNPGEITINENGEVNLKEQFEGSLDILSQSIIDLEKYVDNLQSQRRAVEKQNTILQNFLKGIATEEEQKQINSILESKKEKHPRVKSQKQLAGLLIQKNKAEINALNRRLLRGFSSLNSKEVRFRALQHKSVQNLIQQRVNHEVLRMFDFINSQGLEKAREEFQKFNRAYSAASDMNTQTKENLLNGDAENIFTEGLGEYDFDEIIKRIGAKYPQYKNLLKLISYGRLKLGNKIIYVPESDEEGGHYSIAKDETVIRQNASIHVILHELMHAATAGVIKANEDARKEVRSFMNYVSDYINTKFNEGRNSFFYGYAGSDIYAFSKEEEFIVEVFSNPEFQELLKMIPARNAKYQNAFMEILNEIFTFLKDLLNRHKYRMPKNAFEEAFNLGVDIIGAQAGNKEHIIAAIEDAVRRKQQQEENSDQLPINAINRGRTVVDVASDIKIQKITELQTDIDIYSEQLNKLKEKRIADHFIASTKEGLINKIESYKQDLKKKGNLTSEYDYNSLINQINRDLDGLIEPVVVSFSHVGKIAHDYNVYEPKKIKIKINLEKINSLAKEEYDHRITLLESRIKILNQRLNKMSDRSLQSIIDEYNITDTNIYHGVSTVPEEQKNIESNKDALATVGVKLDKDYQETIIKHLETDEMSYTDEERKVLVDVAKALFQYFDKNGFKINVVNRPYSEQEAKGHSSAVSTTDKYATVYYTKQLNQESPFLTLLHELLHIATNDAMPFDAMGRAIDNEQLQYYYDLFCASLSSIPGYRENAIKILNAKTNEELEAIPFKFRALYHASESVGEFLSSFLNEKEVRDHLASITVEQGKSLLSWLGELLNKVLERIFKGFETIQKPNVLNDIKDFLLNYQYKGKSIENFEPEYKEAYEKSLQEREKKYNAAISYKDIVKTNNTINQSEQQSETSKTQPINTHQESMLPDFSLEQKMRQTWTPQTIQHRAIRFSRIFSSIVSRLENELPDIERLSTSSATRKYLITMKHGTGNILRRVKDEITNTYANKEWVTDYVHDLFEEQDWQSPECIEKINHIYAQGQLMLEYFEPLCLEASEEIKRLEGVSVLTEDGEVIEDTDEELLTDEELQTKHEEGWYHENHEQSLESTMNAETIGVLANLYETDEEGNYVRFDDLEQPIPLDFSFVTATTAQIIGNLTVDKQMIPALKKAVNKYPWMQQILDMLCGRDTETSALYQGLSDEDIALKSLSIQGLFWKDMHHPYVFIAEQTEYADNEESSKEEGVKCRIVNRKEGEEALLRQFEIDCYNNQTLFHPNHKPYKAVYKSDGTFNEANYNALHAEVQSSQLYYHIPALQVTEEDIDLIDRVLKSFGANIPIENIRRLFDTSQGVTSVQQDNANRLKNVIFGFYATNKDNPVLQSVKSEKEGVNIFDAFRENYKILAQIFGDESMGFEESVAHISVDGEEKSLFSRIFPNLIHTIINKLKNLDGISEANYQERMQQLYGHNWWFAPRSKNGRGIFRKGLIKDLVENVACRAALRIKTLKSSMDVSYKQEIAAQAERTRLNEFWHTKRSIGGMEFRDYSVPTFSDTSESYYMSMRYFDISDATAKDELLDRLCDVLCQELDRINVVETRAAINKKAIDAGQKPPIMPIANWDIAFDKEGNRIETTEDGSNFHFFSTLNAKKEAVLNELKRYEGDPDKQREAMKRIIEKEVLEPEFQFYLDQYNQWQVNELVNKDGKSTYPSLANYISENIQYLTFPDENTANIVKTSLRSIEQKLRNNVLSEQEFQSLKAQAAALFGKYGINDGFKNLATSTINSYEVNTEFLDKLKDYFWNSFYANTQIINITLRDPAFLGTPDKFQKRFKMFYSPVSTAYTSHYMYDEEGNLKLQPEGKLTKSTEYSLILRDDEVLQVASFENIKAAIEQRVTDNYLTREQAEEILRNLSALYAKMQGEEGWKKRAIVRSDAQCYRTLPSWQMCLNMIGQGYNKKMQQSINRLMDPDKYGEWSYEDYHNVWEIFKPFVAGYSQTESGLKDEPGFDSQYENIEMPVMHKNAEFLLLAMYTQLSGVMKDNWRLKAINEFMVKHGIDKIQFESGVKLGNQAPIDLSGCTSAEDITSTLEAATQLTGNMQAQEGNQQVVHSMPFTYWGISTSMPEHLLEHEESSMGTQLMKIVMEGVATHPNKVLKVGKTEKTYKQWLELYQAIHVQNLKDDFEKVGVIFNSNEELATYLRTQILNQNKYSHELLKHLELDENGNFKYPIIDPLLRSQFDSLCASLVRNRVTKRMCRMGALPQVASYGFEGAAQPQLRFTDRQGNLILTEEEFNKRGSNIEGITLWADYQEYAKHNCTNLAYMEVYLPPFDTTVMKKVNDAFIYKENVYDKNGKLIHRSGEFNMELFEKKVGKKLLNGLANRVPTETKHSMIPIKAKGFLASQNSSCVVCPAEWIAISDSDNDGDKLYCYFYASHVVWDIDAMKKAWASHYKWEYIPKNRRSQRNKKSKDEKKSEELDIMWEATSKYDTPSDEIARIVHTKDTEGNLIQSITFPKDESAGLIEFKKQAFSMFEAFGRIEPIPYKEVELERKPGESDRDYHQRIDLESIKSNNHNARNNKLLDLMIAVLQTDDNTAQILIPGGFPIAKKVAKRMKGLMGIKDNACSICNPAIRTIQQVRNMAGRNLIGIYANHRSLRPLLEQSDATVHPNNVPVINGNRSLPRNEKGLISLSLSAEKNAVGEFISDNISNFSGASVDNAKDPVLSHLGQNEVTAPISMALIHMGYTIDEVAAFMNQPSIKECVREYLLKGRKGFLADIINEKRLELKKLSENATERDDTLDIKTLDNAIIRDAQGLIPTANDNYTQYVVLENLIKVLPLSQALQNVISVTKTDTQVGALKSRSSENKIKLQLMDRLSSKVIEESYPIQGLEKLIPMLYAESDVNNSAVPQVPQVAAFRYYGFQSIESFMKRISMTFNDLVDEVHNVALDIIDGVSLTKETVDALTDATVSYLFSKIPAFSKMSREETIQKTVDILSEIKQKNLIQENPLIKDLTVNKRGNRYSRYMPFIRLNSNKKNLRNIQNYKRAWASLIVNGNNVIPLESGSITYKELSDLLLHYCFITRGLNTGGQSFIQCFPESQIESIEGYLEQLQKITYLQGDPNIADIILDQYIANHPEDYHFVHRVDAKKFNVTAFLGSSRVVPTVIKITDLSKESEFINKVKDRDGGVTAAVAYPYLYFQDRAGHRYLYKGRNIPGGIEYHRMQVLGNNYGYMEEYEQGKSVMFGENNFMKSAIPQNNKQVVSTDMTNAIDKKIEETVKAPLPTSSTEERKEGLTEEDWRKTIEEMLQGTNVEITKIVLDEYHPMDKDLTGMEFCITI